MKTIYLVKPGLEGAWTPVPGDPWYENGRALTRTLLRPLFNEAVPADAEWVVPEVEWLELEPPPQICVFGTGFACFEPGRDPGIDHYFASADLLPLGGAAEGWVVARFGSGLELGIQPSQFRTAPAVVELDASLVPDRYVGSLDRVMQFVTIEDDELAVDDDPSACGLRAWCRHHEISGLGFKKFWTEDQATVYDEGWSMASLTDPSILD